MGRSLLGKKYVVGIDEAGRGPIAGPISFGLVLFGSEAYKRYKRGKNSLPFGKDSKKLSEKARESYFNQITELKRRRELRMEHVFVSNRMIDKKGLAWSIHFAIRNGLKKLNLNKEETLILLDGGLKAPSEFSQRTIIKGDEKETVIGLASILAKVKRDTYMKKISVKYPSYDFQKHKGYGTSSHYKLIQEHGLSPIHRSSFLRGKGLA